MKKVLIFLFAFSFCLYSCSTMISDLGKKNKKETQTQEQTQNQNETQNQGAQEHQGQQNQEQNQQSGEQNQQGQQGQQTEEQNQQEQQTQPEITYQILHYKQNILDDEYTLFETETITAQAGTQTTAKAKPYYGFTSKDFSQASIASDSSTKVSIYYDRKEFTITLNLNGGSFPQDQNCPLTITAKYETQLDIPSPEKSNYIFCGWNKIGGDLPDSIQKTATYTAYWLKDSDTPQYIVSYKTAYDTPPANFIAAQGTIITPENLPPLSALGQIFDGWYIGDEKILADQYVVQSNICIEAHWSKGKPIYKVRHWKQSPINNSKNYLAEEDIFEGNKGALTQAMPKEYTGYYSGPVTQKTISEANDTVVDIYYFIFTGYTENASGIGIQLQNDFQIELTSKMQEQSLVVTAAQGFSSYEWKIDSRAPDGITEITTEEAPNVLTITDFKTREEGTYNINVTAIKNGIEYSGLLLQPKE